MLSLISWQQYFVAITTITALYYLYIAGRYYQIEIVRLFQRELHSADMFAGLAAVDMSVMGQAKPDNGVTLTDARELLFSPSDPEVWNGQDPDLPETGEEERKSLLEDADQLIDAFSEVDDKAEFMSLLKMLIESSIATRDEADLHAVQAYVVEAVQHKLKFPVSLADFQLIG